MMLNPKPATESAERKPQTQPSPYAGKLEQEARERLKAQWLDYIAGKSYPDSDDVAAFAAQVEERERERCAKIAEQDCELMDGHAPTWGTYVKTPEGQRIAVAIRERSVTRG